eukprot:Phypoly_transcript_11167.p1 GENE.Phypoly_transcript_11167~~Phypoly_transcript_11167.p1  ORF type:complete len:176 (+),score=25.98 Phypoly_transcript_11167:72-599(+)
MALLHVFQLLIEGSEYTNFLGEFFGGHKPFSPVHGGTKVFVTGATGYVGSRVVDQLLAAGHQVVGLCRNEERAKVLRSKGVEALIGDVREIATLEKAARQADAVLHLAFIRDFAKYEESTKIDRDLINAFAHALKETNKPLVGTLFHFHLPPLPRPSFSLLRYAEHSLPSLIIIQ